VFYNFKVITLSGAARVGGKVGYAQRHTLFGHLKNEFLAEIFSRNLGQNIPIHALFVLEKRL